MKLKNVEIYTKYYSDINYDVYNQILSIQPKKRIYKDWLLNLFRENKLKLEDLYKAEEYLSFYDRPNIKSKFGGEGYIKNINDLPELFNLIEPFKSVELSPKEFKDKVYDETFVKEFKNYNLYIPKTYEQSCKLGKGTQWCTATEKTREHYDKYNNQGNLMIFISKSDITDKYQFHLVCKQYMNKNDQEIDTVHFMEKNLDIREYFVSFKDEFSLLLLYNLTNDELLIKQWIKKYPLAYNYIKNKIVNLSKFVIDDKSNLFNYMNNSGYCILQYNFNTCTLYIFNYVYDKVLENKYDIKYSNFLIVTKYIANLYYNLNIKNVHCHIDQEGCVEIEGKYKLFCN